MEKPGKDFCQAVCQLVGPQHLLVPGAVAPEGQDLALLVEVCVAPANPFLQAVEVPMDQHINLGP